MSRNVVTLVNVWVGTQISLKFVFYFQIICELEFSIRSLISKTRTIEVLSILFAANDAFHRIVQLLQYPEVFFPEEPSFHHQALGRLKKTSFENVQGTRYIIANMKILVKNRNPERDKQSHSTSLLRSAPQNALLASNIIIIIIWFFLMFEWLNRNL